MDEENLRESGGNSQAAWRSARAIASGRLVAGRPPAWTPPRRPLRRSPGARRPLRRGFNRMPEQQRQEVTTAWRSARAIASGRLFAGRPPAWTPPRRPPGARRPLRRGFNRMPEQPGVQRVQSPLEGFSPGVHLRGGRHGDRLCGRPAPGSLSGAVSTACLSWQTRLVPQRRTTATQRVQWSLPFAASAAAKWTFCRRLRCDVIQSATHDVRGDRASPTCLPDSHAQKCVPPARRCLVLRRSNPSAGYIRYFVRATRRDC